MYGCSMSGIKASNRMLGAETSWFSPLQEQAKGVETSNGNLEHEHQTQTYPATTCNPFGKSSYLSQSYNGISVPQGPIPASPHLRSTHCSSLLPNIPNGFYLPYAPTDFRYKPFIDPIMQYMKVETSFLQQKFLSHYEHNLLLRRNNATTKLRNLAYFLSKSPTDAQINKNEERKRINQSLYPCPPLMDKYHKKNGIKITKTTESANGKTFRSYEAEQFNANENLYSRKRKYTDFSINNILYETTSSLTEQTYQYTYDYSNKEFNNTEIVVADKDTMEHFCSEKEVNDGPTSSTKFFGSNSSFEESIPNCSMKKRIKSSFDIFPRKAAERDDVLPCINMAGKPLNYIF